MKKLLLQFSVLCLLMPLLAPTCRSDEFDPAKGLTIDLDVKSESINANATKAGEKFTKTLSFNLGDEFKTRYNIDPSQLTELNINALNVTINQANCLKLKSFSVLVAFPGLPTPLTVTDCGAVALLDNTVTNRSPLINIIFKTNFAPEIRAGKSITVTFEMEAREAIESGQGVTATLNTRAVYKPK